MERLGRRDFLRLGTIAGGSFVIGRVFGEMGYPFIGIPFDKEPLTREEFATRLNYQGSAVIPEDPYVKKSKNRMRAFSNEKMMTNVAFHLLQREKEIGIKASAILRKKPLNITLTEDTPFEITTSSGLTPAGATYTPILKGGPEIRIHDNLITGYYRAKRDADYESLKDHDTLIFHEFVHFFQDVEDPFRLPKSDLWVRRQERINKDLEEPVDVHDNEVENEAQKIAEEEVFGPYGYLFSFYEI